MSDLPQPRERARIHWDSEGQPISAHFDDVYFSKESGIEESRYVFIDGNQLQLRWSQKLNKPHFTIAETGFGTGLNFLVAWQTWQSSPAAGRHQLHFISVEKHPLSLADLRRALSLWPSLQVLSDALCSAYPPQPASGMHRLHFDNGNVVLTLIFEDAKQGFEQLQAHAQTPAATSFGGPTPTVDAWFLDGFSPSKNADMWDHRLFEIMALLSAEQSTFATFTVVARVRQGLSQCGFTWQKKTGFARKREMLVGRAGAKASSSPQGFTWHVIEASAASNHCIVIGGGMAGAHTAFALARRNIPVSLLERSTLADGASGNRHGTVYAKLSPYTQASNEFNFRALVFANRFYNHTGLFGSCGDQCGVLYLAQDEKTATIYQDFCRQFDPSSPFSRWLTAEQCSEHSGIDIKFGGVLVANSGWLSPPQVCQRMCEHKHISVEENFAVEALHRDGGQWHVVSGAGEVRHADTVIIANAHDARRFSQTQDLPLKSIRGQVSYLLASEDSSKLRTVVCGDGYISPSDNGSHTCGASFNLDDSNPQLSTYDHLQNLERIASLSPTLRHDSWPSSLHGRVGMRCTTPDYLPLVGPVMDRELMLERFSAYRKNAQCSIFHPGPAQPQLYCNLGHGSRGLCYTPLASEILASIISGQYLPIGIDLFRYLHPGRFLIRDLMRNKV